MSGELTSDQLQQLYLCSLLLGRKREQPIFTCKAHVFHIDPKTKRSWIPASNAAVNVSFFYDSTRNLYRIISVENTKAVINSTITSSMTFTKTSQKFGQWSDVRANTVYGLGFPNENELNQFIEKFQEVKEATRQSGHKITSNGTATTPTTSATASPVVSRSNQSGPEHGITLNPPNQSLDPTVPVPSTGAPAIPDKPQSQVNHQRSQSLTTSQPTSDSPKHQPKVGEKVGATFATAGTAPVGEAQLKYENERLKAALAQSSANAKKWEIELQTLKTNNARLTSALQESTANVEEWKRQLQAYKDENARTRTRLLELEASKGNTDAAIELRKELQSMKSKVEAVDVELQSKEEEIKLLTRKLMDVTAKAGDDRVKVVLQENDSLKSTISRLQSQLEIALAAHESQRRVLDALNIQFGERIHDLSTIHEEINTALNT